MNTQSVEYQLKFDKFGKERKYKLNKKRRLKIIDNSTWIEADTKNQWYYKDYKCFYIVISLFKPNEYTVTCSGFKMNSKFNSLEKAKVASLKFCDKISL